MIQVPIIDNPFAYNKFLLKFRQKDQKKYMKQSIVAMYK